jgi:L-lactate dehydrogenase (cytochrome)
MKILGVRRHRKYQIPTKRVRSVRGLDRVLRISAQLNPRHGGGMTYDWINRYMDFLHPRRSSRRFWNGNSAEGKMVDKLTAQEVSRHKSLDDLWLVIHGQVYDFTDFVREHPGGIAVILARAGRDATESYSEVHSPNLVKSTLSPSKHLGSLADGANGALLPKDDGRSYKRSSKAPLECLISSHDFEAAAADAFSPKAWAFVSSAATDLHTMRRNAEAYSHITLRPRVLRDVGAVDTSMAMLGHKLRLPVFCAPTAMAKLIHPDGEKALGQACKEAGIAQCVSTNTSFVLSEIVEAVDAYKTQIPYEVPLFFQLYVDKNRANSERLLREAQRLGARAVFLTVDAPLPGKREADERVQSDESLRSPVSGAAAKNDLKGGALGRIMGSYIDASVSWDDIPWLRRTVPGMPIILKGIQTWMDAVKAMEAGVDGIVVSNHGGRSLDTAPATILVLLELRKRCPEVFGAMEVYVDGGITRGTDIFKALCLGARAVGIGRGLLYALNYGVDGATRYLESKSAIINPHQNHTVGKIKTPRLTFEN